MKASVLILLSVMLVACTTRPMQYWPETQVDTKGNKTKVLRMVMYPGNSSIDKPATKDTIMYVCPIEDWDKSLDALRTTENCVPEHTHGDGVNQGHTMTTRTHDTASPVLSNALPALILGGSIMGSAVLLRPSRTTVEQTGGGASSDSSAYQKQSADIDVRGGGRH